MQVTLRKAAKLSKSLLDQAGAINYPLSVAVSMYGDETPAEVAQKVREQRTGDLQGALLLIAAGYEVRGLIDGANHASGISTILTVRAATERQEKTLSTIVDSMRLLHQAETPAIASRKLQAMKERTDESRYAHEESVVVRTIEDDEVKALKVSIASLRRTKASLDDDLLAKNGATTVTLPENVVTLLRQYNLI